MGQLKDKFLQRVEYDQIDIGFAPPVLPSLYTNYYLDSWNIIPLYGKVDTFGIPIIPRRALITNCSYAKDKSNVLALQPTTFFFDSLRQQYLDYYAFGSINKNSKFFKKDLIPLKGFVDGDVEYTNKIKQLYSNFVEYEKVSNTSVLARLWRTNTSNKIRNFENFIDELYNFMSFKDLYFTRAGYVESIDYSILHSGLAIDIYEGDVDDEIIRQEFLNDINFPSFVELCLRNNIKIDREIPWRLYIDVRTVPNPENNFLPFSQLDFQTSIKKYLPFYKNNLQEFFDFYYTKVIPYDDTSYVYFQEFINLINSFYKTYINDFPTFKEYYINNCGFAKVKDVSRLNMPKLSTEDYLRMYFNFRNIELNKVVQKEILLDVSLKSIEIFLALKSELDVKKSITSAVKYYTDSIGTLAYRNTSIYELDAQSKMP